MKVALALHSAYLTLFILSGRSIFTSSVAGDVLRRTSIQNDEKVFNATTICPRGQYYASRDLSCLPCASGQFSDTASTSESCSYCLSGQYSSIEKFSCSLCPAGHFSSLLMSYSGCYHASPILNVKLGSFGTPLDVFSLAQRCAVEALEKGCNVVGLQNYQHGECWCGHIVPQLPNSHNFGQYIGGCAAYPTGNFATNNQSSPIYWGGNMASAQYIISALDTNSCQKCPEGQFSLSGSPTCFFCPSGYFSTPGSSSCSICSPGYYNSLLMDFAGCFEDYPQRVLDILIRGDDGLDPDETLSVASDCATSARMLGCKILGLQYHDTGECWCSQLSLASAMSLGTSSNCVVTYNSGTNGLFWGGGWVNAIYMLPKLSGCQLCPVGQYQYLPGQQLCLPCPMGQSSQLGATVCSIYLPISNYSMSSNVAPTTEMSVSTNVAPTLSRSAFSPHVGSPCKVYGCEIDCSGTIFPLINLTTVNGSGVYLRHFTSLRKGHWYDFEIPICGSTPSDIYFLGATYPRFIAYKSRTLDSRTRFRYMLGHYNASSWTYRMYDRKTAALSFKFEGYQPSWQPDENENFMSEMNNCQVMVILYCDAFYNASAPFFDVTLQTIPCKYSFYVGLKEMCINKNQTEVVGHSPSPTSSQRSQGNVNRTMTGISLIHRYSFNENLADSIGGEAWNATLSGGSYLADNKVYFNWAGSTLVTQADSSIPLVRLPPSITGDNTTSFTIEAWATFASNLDDAKLFQFGDSFDNSNSISVSRNSFNGNLYMSFQDKNVIEINNCASNGYSLNGDSGVRFDRNTFHVVFTFDSFVGTAMLYVDSKLRFNYTGILPKIYNTSLNYLGASLSPKTVGVVGFIDEFRVWTGQLSNHQIISNYINGPDEVFINGGNIISKPTGTASSKNLPAKLTSYNISHRYSFNGNFNDSVGASVWNDVHQHGVSFSSDGQAIFELNTTLQHGPYIQFPPAITGTSNQPFTVEIWATFEGSRNVSCLFEIGDYEGTFSDKFREGNHLNFEFVQYSNFAWTAWQRHEICTNSTGISYHCGGFRIGGNTSYGMNSLIDVHLVFTYDALEHNAQIYIDRHLAWNHTGTLPAIFNTQYNFLGKSLSREDAGFVGSINEFRVWSGVLPYYQIQSNYQQGPDSINYAIDEQPKQRILKCPLGSFIAGLNGTNGMIETSITFACSDATTILGPFTITLGGMYQQGESFSAGYSGTPLAYLGVFYRAEPYCDIPRVAMIIACWDVSNCFPTFAASMVFHSYLYASAYVCSTAGGNITELHANFDSSHYWLTALSAVCSESAVDSCPNSLPVGPQNTGDFGPEHSYDCNWRIVSVPQGEMINTTLQPPTYIQKVPDGPKVVTPSPFTQQYLIDTLGLYTFETKFILPEYASYQCLSLTMRLAADNTIQSIFFNGIDQNVSFGGIDLSSTFTAFTISSGFAGLNVLQFIVENFKNNINSNSKSHPQYNQSSTGIAVIFNELNGCTCEGGFFNVGSSDCMPCTAGQYSLGGGSNCTTCPVGQTSNSGASSCYLFNSSPMVSPSSSSIPIFLPTINLLSTSHPTTLPTVLSSSFSTKPTGTENGISTVQNSTNLSPEIIVGIVFAVITVCILLMFVCVWWRCQSCQCLGLKSYIYFVLPPRYSLPERQIYSTDTSKEYCPESPGAAACEVQCSSEILSRYENVPLFDWSDDSVELQLNNLFVDEGTFGSVIRAYINRCNCSVFKKLVREEVVIKLFKVDSHPDNQSKQVPSSQTLKSPLHQAMSEAHMMIELRSRLGYKECIVQVYGVIHGKIQPKEANLILAMHSGTENPVGIVLRYEAGGSLKSNIHRVDDRPPLSLPIKIKLLGDVARGLAELHALGVSHGDIKPDNILLSNNAPPDAKLADFGLAEFKRFHNVIDTSLINTTHSRGTYYYSAPEMILKISGESCDQLISRTSRKADIYAFAILCWEVLTEEAPFEDQLFTNEFYFSNKLHLGYRPPICKLPKDCPENITSMIATCWSADRSERKSALECWSILQRQFFLMNKIPFDVSVTFCSNNQGLADYLFYLLNLKNLRVFKSNITENGIENDVTSARILVIILSKAYQIEPECLKLLSLAHNAFGAKCIVTITTEPDPPSWMNSQIAYYCQLGSKTTLHLDVSSYNYNWNLPVINWSTLSPLDSLKFKTEIENFITQIRSRFCSV